MKVLVVEDDPRITDVLEYALKADGYEVQTARRGREAIQIAKRSSPGVMVLDVGLPDIDGFEVCRSVRAFSDVPIIFLTSRSDEIDRVVGLEIGGDDYVVKPCGIGGLLARAFVPADLPERRRALRQLAHQAVQIPGPRNFLEPIFFAERQPREILRDVTGPFSQIVLAAKGSSRVFRCWLQLVAP